VLADKWPGHSRGARGSGRGREAIAISVWPAPFVNRGQRQGEEGRGRRSLAAGLDLGHALGRQQREDGVLRRRPCHRRGGTPRRPKQRLSRYATSVVVPSTYLTVRVLSESTRHPRAGGVATCGQQWKLGLGGACRPISALPPRRSPPPSLVLFLISEMPPPPLVVPSRRTNRHRDPRRPDASPPGLCCLLECLALWVWALSRPGLTPYDRAWVKHTQDRRWEGAGARIADGGPPIVVRGQVAG
jgi:hypothetical protein